MQTDLIHKMQMHFAEKITPMRFYRAVFFYCPGIQSCPTSNPMQNEKEMSSGKKERGLLGWLNKVYHDIRTTRKGRLSSKVESIQFLFHFQGPLRLKDKGSGNNFSSHAIIECATIFTDTIDYSRYLVFQIVPISPANLADENNAEQFCKPIFFKKKANAHLVNITLVEQTFG